MGQGDATKPVAMMDSRTHRKAMLIVAVLLATPARMATDASTVPIVSAVSAAMGSVFHAAIIYKMPMKPMWIAAAAAVTHVTTHLAARSRRTAYRTFALKPAASLAATKSKTAWRATSTVVD